MSIHPTELHLKESEGTLEITWSDDHSFTYALRYLRGWCPCANCQGHFSAKKTFIEDVDLTLSNVEPVGGYAVTPTWGDGHYSGIYTYQYLLALEQGPPDPGPDNEACLKYQRDQD